MTIEKVIIDDLIKTEARLKHAALEVTSYDPNTGKVEIERHHYLTCEKCRIRRTLGMPPEDPFARKDVSVNP